MKFLQSIAVGITIGLILFLLNSVIQYDRLTDNILSLLLILSPPFLTQVLLLKKYKLRIKPVFLGLFGYVSFIVAFTIYTILFIIFKHAHLNISPEKSLLLNCIYLFFCWGLGFVNKKLFKPNKNKDQILDDEETIN